MKMKGPWRFMNWRWVSSSTCRMYSVMHTANQYDS
jgi:hypothetical protein